jgi:hypothetical protein
MSVAQATGATVSGNSKSSFFMINPPTLVRKKATNSFSR